MGRASRPETPPAPGWYPDPWSATGSGERYFDGKRWGTTERPLGRESAPLEPVRTRVPRAGAGRGRTVVSVLIVLALVGVVWFLQRPDGGSSGSSAAPAAPAASQSRLADQPPAGTGESAHRLAPAIAAPAGTGGYSLMLHQPNDVAQPVAFDPCRPIHYVVNLDGAPSDGLPLVQDAIATVAARTGLKFVYDGPTAEAPSKQRAAYQPQTYDRKRWAPVLIAWSDERASPDLAGYIAGVGGPEARSPAQGPAVYVTGQVVLDREQLSEVAVPDRGEVRAIVLHELGHLVGLDHVADRSQLMFSEAEFAVRDYGAGDLRGLALVGNGACVPGV